MAVIENERKKGSGLPNLIQKLVVFIIKGLFPSFIMIKVSSLVRQASFSEHPWVKKQLKRSSVAAVALLIPTAIGLLGCFSLYQDVVDLKKSQPLAFNMKRGQVKQPKIDLSSEDFKHFKSMAIGDLILISIPVIISGILRKKIKFLKETEDLRAILLKNGISKEGEERLAIVLPIGVLMDISGYSAKDIALNEGIWNTINVDVDQQDWDKSLKKNSIVMFRRQFKLSNSYVF